MFAKFPEFTKLDFSHRKEYEEFIKDFPPVHDISFGALMTWWSPLDNMAISELNGNLVVPYWLPGSEKHSGLSLVGSNQVDESICQIFDHLRDKGETPRLVNVPEFVVANVAYPDLFTFRHERFYDEYVLSLSNFYPLKNMTNYRRHKVEKQMVRAGESKVIAKSIDLSVAANRRMLLSAVDNWQAKGINNYGKVERDAIRECIEHNEEYGQEGLCLFVGQKLYGFCLYSVPSDKRYVTVKHIKATHVSTLGFELIAYTFARWFTEQGFLYVNVNADFGVMKLRMFMLTLGPVNFFRKYTIEPRSK